MYYKYVPCQILSHDFDEKSDFFNYEFPIRLPSITQFKNGLVKKERVGSREDVTSTNQDTKTNAATLVCRRGVPGSCFILRSVFLSMLALEKIMPSSRYVENSTSSFGRLRQKIALKCVPHVQLDYISPFNQSNRWFVALTLPLPSSLLKLPIVAWGRHECAYLISKMTSACVPCTSVFGFDKFVWRYL